MMIKLFRAFYTVLFSLLKNKIQLWLFSCSVMSNSLQPHGLQHTRLPCRSPPPGVCSNTCPHIQWCYPTISSSVTPFSSCLQSFLASGRFPSVSVLWVRWPKYWSVSFRISPSSEYSGLISFRMDWLDLLAVREILKSLLEHHSLKVSILGHLAFFLVQRWKNHSFDYMDLCQQSNVSAFYSESGESVLKLLALFSDSRVQQDPM